MHQPSVPWGAMRVDRCINLLVSFGIQSFLTCNTINKMAEKEMALIERMRMAREVKALQVELGDCRMQLQFKDGKIEELQRMVVQMQDHEIQENIAVEEEIQCCLDRPAETDQRDLLTRLSGMLTQREEQGVGLHLATIEKDGQITALTAALAQTQELNNNLQQELGIQAAAMNDQQSFIDSMKNQNFDLRERLAQLESILADRDSELVALRDSEVVVALRESRQNLRILQEKRVTLQHIIIQNQKQREEEGAQEGKLMVALLEKEVGVLLQEKEKMKKTINNYQWKLFCLETELDLSNKEKKQYKYVNDKHETKIGELEATIKQMTIKVYSLQEEVKAIQDENRYYETDSDLKQRKIEQLLIHLDESSAAGEQVKELQYRLRQKDQQLTQITNYLKEKMKEHHETKLKCAQLEKSLPDLHKKVEKAEYEAYQMEQCIIEHEEIMQRQTERIDQSSRETDFLNGKINELSLMNMLRTQEFEEKVTALQSALKEKSSKVNQLSVEIIQREIEWNKKLEYANQGQKERVRTLEQRNKELTCNLSEAKGVVNSLTSRLRESEEEVAGLSDLANSKSGQINKIVGKMNALQLAVKEKEKLMQYLQAEIKIAKAEFKEARLLNRRLQEEMQEMRQVIALNEQKLKILKKEAVENIEGELKNELQMEQLKRQLANIDAERSQLSAARKYSEQALEHAREVIEELQSASKLRLHQIVAQLTKPLPDADETTTFEVLADEQEMGVVHQTVHERERKELLRLMGEYSRQVEELCLKMQKK